MGDGPNDIVMAPGVVSNIEAFHELPRCTAFLRRLASFARVVTDLVSGAGLRFSERGSHELKGLPGCWDLFAADA